MKFKTILVLALALQALTAVAQQEVQSVGLSTGSGAIDQFISAVKCDKTSAGERIILKFSCAEGTCKINTEIAKPTDIAYDKLKLGRTAFGDVVVFNKLGDTQAEMTFYMCKDGLFNSNTADSIQVIGLQILNYNAPSNTNGYGQFIANVWFGISGSHIESSFY